ncbi:MAG: hypothetical protein OHK0046_36180 [Anaerolineae bacterium]
MSAGIEAITVEILVTGLPSSGKSTLMQTISHQTGYENDDPTSWHTGTLTVEEGLDVHFVEPPSLDHFDFIELRDLISDADVHGFIVMCDSTLPEFFGETLSILQMIRAYHPETPCVLVGNKQDEDHAWSAEDIRIGLGIPNDILVLPCVAMEQRSVKQIVLALLYKIFP